LKGNGERGKNGPHDDTTGELKNESGKCIMHGNSSQTSGVKTGRKKVTGGGFGKQTNISATKEKGQTKELSKKSAGLRIEGGHKDGKKRLATRGVD